MKIGIAYNVFEGEELLEFVLSPIRSELDFVCVIYQTTSFFGNTAHEELVSNLKKLGGLIDELIEAPQLGEVGLRNLGLERSRAAGCTHHISSDVDEFYLPDQLAYAKSQVEGYDCSVVRLENYYKRPTWRITPCQNQLVSFIHPVEAEYGSGYFPYNVDLTRRCTPCEFCKEFEPREVTMHHMSFVRKNMGRKLYNNANSAHFNIPTFLADFDKYELGGRLRMVPDFMNRRTVLVDNIFNIEVK